MPGLRVLLIEDSPSEAALISGALASGGFRVAATRVDSDVAFRSALQDGDWDVILFDHGIPGFSADGVLSLAQEHTTGVPVIVVSGDDSEAAGVEFLRAGLWGYVLKHALERLPAVVERALRERATNTALAEAEHALVNSRSYFESALDAIVVSDADGSFLEVNNAACEIFGLEREELLKARWSDFRSDGAPEYRVLLERFLGEGGTRGESRLLMPDGRTRYLDFTESADIAPGRHLTILRDVTERNEIFRELELERSRLSEVQRIARVGSLDWDPDTDQVVLSAEALSILGKNDGEPREMSLRDALELVVEADRARAESMLVRAARTRAGERYELRVYSGDRVRWIRGETHVSDDDALRPRITAVLQDVTEWREAEVAQAQLERQLAQARRLESVGQLAGGVAHDFNNLLAVILNYAEFAREALGDNPVTSDLEAISTAARQASDLTRRLLLFSSAEPSTPQVLDLGERLDANAKLLARALGENIELSLETDPGTLPVEADPSQLDQIVLNLAINARDAMESGGTLTFVARNVLVEPPGTHALEPGRYVLLEARDTGCGMPHEVVERAFDPFFTTKPQGQGTGLGLATVYGIVRERGGHCEISSAPGEGSTVSIYLPASSSDGRAAQGAGEDVEPLPPGGARVLVVEDDLALIKVTTRLLETAGYEVIAVRDPREALEVETEPEIVLTDVVMPGMGGPELAAELAARWPRVEVIFTSGYATRPHRLPPGSRFVAKPFSREQLLEQVGLAAAARAASSGG